MMPWWYWTFFLGGIAGCLIWQQPLFTWSVHGVFVFVAYGLFITLAWWIGDKLGKRKFNKENP